MHGHAYVIMHCGVQYNLQSHYGDLSSTYVRYMTCPILNLHFFPREFCGLQLLGYERMVQEVFCLQETRRIFVRHMTKAN